jgi:hypothetical protein
MLGFTSTISVVRRSALKARRFASADHDCGALRARIFDLRFQ